MKDNPLLTHLREACLRASYTLQQGASVISMAIAKGLQQLNRGRKGGFAWLRSRSHWDHVPWERRLLLGLAVVMAMMMVVTAFTSRDSAPVLTAAVIGLVSALYLEDLRTEREARNLALAFGGEIQALQQILKIRRYEEGIQQYIELMQTEGKPFYIRSRINREYFGVYKENLGRIGMLPAPLPQRIATLYTMANAILDDFENVADPANEPFLTTEVLIALYEQLDQLLQKVTSLGDQILADISRQYGVDMRSSEREEPSP